jgi:hypothetical protein
MEIFIFEADEVGACDLSWYYMLSLPYLTQKGIQEE